MKTLQLIALFIGLSAASAMAQSNPNYKQQAGSNYKGDNNNSYTLVSKKKNVNRDYKHANVTQEENVIEIKKSTPSKSRNYKHQVSNK